MSSSSSSFRVFLSLRRNPSLHACHNFLSLAMWLQVGPTYWIKSSHHLVLGRPRGLLFPWGIHSVILIVHLLSRLLATWPAHLCLLSLMLLIMSVKPLCFRIHSVLFLSLRVTPIMILSIFLWVVTSFLKLGVAKRPGLTAICHYWEYTFIKCFPLQSHWHIFVSHDVVQFTECTPSLADSPFHFLYLVMVLSHHLSKIYITVNLLDLLSINNHIILVDMPCCTLFWSSLDAFLRPTDLLMYIAEIC